MELKIQSNATDLPGVYGSLVQHLELQKRKLNYMKGFLSSHFNSKRHGKSLL